MPMSYITTHIARYYYVSGTDGNVGFDRGFTGHEHIDEIGLINMNGRMYAPNLGRFLSPDNYIQSPDNPQNYNRYSYCLNNPLRYTDPSGEFVWAPFLIAAAMGGVQGTMLGLQNGAKGWDIGAIMGAISGMASGAYRGWTNAETLGVNHWTGGTLQERAQAWADYYGFKDVNTYVLNKVNIERHNNYEGVYKLEKEPLSPTINASKDGRSGPIDGISILQPREIYLTKAAVRHATFSSSWGKGTFWHEYTHITNQSTYDFLPYKIGLKYGGLSYYIHCKDYPLFQKYGFHRP